MLGRQIVQDGCKKKVKMIFSLPETMNNKKKHVGNNNVENPTKLHKGMHYYLLFSD